jgi:hypothetical protein
LTIAAFPALRCQNSGASGMSESSNGGPNCSSDDQSAGGSGTPALWGFASAVALIHCANRDGSLLRFLEGRHLVKYTGGKINEFTGTDQVVLHVLWSQRRGIE